MAATRLIPLHINKGKTLARCLRERTDYAQNPEKTEKGKLVTAYQCDPMTVEEEFLLAKRQYQQRTGRQQKSDVIAYQIRQSFKPGEVTPEEANRVGYELALRFTKGKHAFIVATHTDRAHIHNHVIFNSTTLDCRRKFQNFYFSSLVVQKVSDIVCLEHGLSVIEPKPRKEQVKRTPHPRKESFRSVLREEIDAVLDQKPDTFEEFLRLMNQAGYECKHGQYIAFRGKGQKRFIRLRSLGAGYSEEDICAVLEAGKRQQPKAVRVNLLIDIQAKLKNRGPAYRRWATVYNLKQMAQTLLFLREQEVESLDALREKADASCARFNELNASLKESERRLIEIAELKKHIFHYSRTRETYVAYRKAGYSKQYFEAHREALTLHKAAKKAFNELGMARLPRIKDLNAEYARVLSVKKQTYAEYREARAEMRAFAKARRNVEIFLELEQKENDRAQREKNQEKSTFRS